MTEPPFVTTGDGLAVAVHDLGGTGPSLVMAHAAGLHGLVLAPLARRLAGAFRCVAFDARGHGDSRLPAAHPLDWYGLADDVLAVVDALGLDRPYGFGHSSGGTAVLMAEQARPGTFAAVYCYEPVIVAADPPLGRDDDSVLGARARHRRMAFASRQEAREHYASKPPLDGVDPEALQAYVDHGFDDDADGGVRLKCRPEDEATVYEMATAHDAWARLPDIACPVMVACGSESDGCPPERGDALVERLRRGRSEVLAGLGHLGPLERPDLVGASVSAFLAGRPARVTAVSAILEEAAVKAGRWPGEVPFVANLERLVGSCRGLNVTGQEVLHRAAVRHLRNLRYLQSYVDDHPDVAHRPLDGAVVVTGLPRTGTTLLHRLLALDPDHRVLRFWEALHPLPPDAGGPPAEVLQAQAERWLDGFRRLVPGFQAIHRATATGPEECDALLQNSFASQHFDDMFDAAAYSSWLAGAPLHDEYAHYALQLRALSGAGGRWVLKSPSHLGHLDALLAALPGATVVVLHRHPHAVVASYASLIATLRRAYSDDVSPAEIGRQALARTATAMGRALDVCAGPLGVCAGPLGAAVIDLSYDELVHDPVAVVRAVYAGRGHPLDAGVEAAVRAWVLAHPQHEHGPHRYGLAEFGLTGAEVDDAFGDYMERFTS